MKESFFKIEIRCLYRASQRILVVLKKECSMSKVEAELHQVDEATQKWDRTAQKVDETAPNGGRIAPNRRVTEPSWSDRTKMRQNRTKSEVLPRLCNTARFF